MRICSVEGCNKPVKTRGLCSSHHMKWYRYGHHDELAILRYRPSGSGCLDSNGYIKVMVNGRSTYEHILLAEKALGKPLPKGAVVHHTGARDDNHGPFKLVVCPSNEYHSLIHKRMKELGYENNQD